MNTSIRFFHTADLHIGRPFSGLGDLDSTWKSRITQATSAAFDNLCGYAIKERVDFLLVAGDVFDRSPADYSDYTLFFTGLKRLAKEGIHTYICAGNHDPYSSWKHAYFAETPSIHVIDAQDPSYFVHYRDGQPLCYIAGRSYKKKVWDSHKSIIEGLSYQDIKQHALEHPAPDILRENTMDYLEKLPVIAMAHTSLDKGNDTRYAPVTKQQLQATGVTYWALGHIHSFECFPDSKKPFAAYSGCLQGGDIGECGDKGFLDVKIALPVSAAKVTFVPASSVCWQDLTVDISRCSTIDAVQELVENACTDSFTQSNSQYLMARVRLTGITPLFTELSAGTTAQELREEVNRTLTDVLVFELVNKTTMEDDAVLSPVPGTFLAGMLEQADKLNAAPDSFRNELINACKELPDEAALIRYLNSLSDEDLKELLREEKTTVARNLMDTA